MTAHHPFARPSIMLPRLMPRPLRRLPVRAAGLALLSLALAAAACTQRDSAGNPIKPVIVTGSVPVSLNIAGTSVSNITLQLTATASFSNGTSRVVTTEAAWRTSNGAVASVSATGLVTAVGNGQAEISATFEGVTGTFPVAVQGL